MRSACHLFVVSGEQSGDQVAAWYIRNRRRAEKQLDVVGIGGNALEGEGVTLYDHFTSLNIVGIFEIFRALPRMYCYMCRLIAHIIDHRYDEVVLVDFPGFNLRLARMLKKKAPYIKITYVSPPQVWVWGAWRVSALKRYSDAIVVLYRHEVAWYSARGVTVAWKGYPFVACHAYLRAPKERKSQIALIPGSRAVELDMLLPRFAMAVHMLRDYYPELEIVVPRAAAIDEADLRARLAAHGLNPAWEPVSIVADPHEKYTALAQCALALTKPGSVTLELAMLGIPSVVGYRTSYATYGLGRLFVRVGYMALPNLLTDQPLFAEYIQGDCKPFYMARMLRKLYGEYLEQPDQYAARCQNIAQIYDQLGQGSQEASTGPWLPTVAQQSQKSS